MATNSPVHAWSHSTQISGRFELAQHNTLNENLTTIITHINKKNSVYHLTAEPDDILDNRNKIFLLVCSVVIEFFFDIRATNWSFFFWGHCFDLKYHLPKN